MDTKCIPGAVNIPYITADKVSGRISDIILPITYNVYSGVRTVGGYKLDKSEKCRKEEGSLETGLYQGNDSDSDEIIYPQGPYKRNPKPWEVNKINKKPRTKEFGRKRGVPR